MLDRTFRTPLDTKLVTDQEAPTWILTTEQASKEKQEALEQIWS